MVSIVLGAFLLVGVVIAWICCLGCDDPPEGWLAGTADGEIQSAALPPRVDGTHAHGGASSSVRCFSCNAISVGVSMPASQNVVSFRQRRK